MTEHRRSRSTGLFMIASPSYRLLKEKVSTEVVYQTKCDSCGKIGQEGDVKGWYGFNSYFSDWGADSIDPYDSYEYFDVCSWSCYLKVVKKEYERYNLEEEGEHCTVIIDDKEPEFLRSMIEGR